jgi:hypothetical protein
VWPKPPQLGRGPDLQAVLLALATLGHRMSTFSKTCANPQVIGLMRETIYGIARTGGYGPTHDGAGPAGQVSNRWTD